MYIDTCNRKDALVHTLYIWGIDNGGTLKHAHAYN